MSQLAKDRTRTQMKIQLVQKTTFSTIKEKHKHKSIVKRWLKEKYITHKDGQ